ncbi:hypothetical protein U1Q18_040635 [Sarracenia purpurea var. burkii]
MALDCWEAISPFIVHLKVGNYEDGCSEKDSWFCDACDLVLMRNAAYFKLENDVIWFYGFPFELCVVCYQNKQNTEFALLRNSIFEPEVLWISIGSFTCFGKVCLDRVALPTFAYLKYDSSRTRNLLLTKSVLILEASTIEKTLFGVGRSFYLGFHGDCVSLVGA